MLKATIEDECVDSYVQCMEDCRRAKRTVHGISDEGRNRGCPFFTWRDTVWRDIIELTEAVDRKTRMKWIVRCASH